MILNGANSDDYIYFRINSIEKYYPMLYQYLKPGAIIRFNIKKLAQILWRPMSTDLSIFEFVEKENKTKYAFLPKDLYDKVIVKQNTKLTLNMDSRDLLVLNHWLWEHTTDDTRPDFEECSLSYMFGTDRCKSVHMLNYEKLQHTPMYTTDGEEIAGSKIFETDDIKSLPSSPAEEHFANFKAIIEANMKHLTGGFNSSPKKALTGGTLSLPIEDKILASYQFGSNAPLYLQLYAGEELDFNSAITNITFLRQDMLRFLLELTPLTEEEKMPYFFNDFVSWIPEAGRRYFKIRDEIKMKDMRDIVRPEVWHTIQSIAPDFNNLFYSDNYRYSHEDDFDRDSEGYIRYIWCKGEPIHELEFSKIAERVDAEEGRIHYLHEIETRKKKEELRELRRNAEKYIKNHQRRYYEAKRFNLDITEIEFYESELRREEETKKILVRKLTRTLNNRIDDLNKNA